MKAIADKLEELDHYFENKKESEKWVMILITAGVFGYLLYTYLFPYAKNKYETSKVEKEQIIKRISEEKSYLSSITVNGDRNYYVKKFNSDIRHRKKWIKDYEKKIALLDSNFQKLSEILFNKKNWSIFLESLSDRANKNEVELLSISSKYIDQNKSFGHVLEMGISCEGRYGNILKFINDIEQSKLVTDVYHTDIGIDKDRNIVRADIKISVWGVNH